MATNFRRVLPLNSCSLFSNQRSLVPGSRWHWTCRRCLSKSSVSPAIPFAFVFDIDGVLLHRSTPIKGAKEALQKLAAANIPYWFMTNGGGRHESKRAQRLRNLLDVKIVDSQVIQSHSPYQELVKRYNKVLVVGSRYEEVKKVASIYGFLDPVSPADIFNHNPAIYPFTPPTETSSISQNLYPIDAILVFDDPFDWGLCTQIMLDLLLSKNRSLPSRSIQIQFGDESYFQRPYPESPDLWFSNPDLLWKADYPQPRLGQGAFKAAFEGVWKAITGVPLKSNTIGKPSREAYQYISDHMRRSVNPNQLRRVYMIGDNPESDIRGANSFHDCDVNWESVLVKTGVYTPEDGLPKYKPSMGIVEDVDAAVNLALSREVKEYGYNPQNFGKSTS